VKEATNWRYRFNVAYEDLNPYIGDTKGHRNLVALAMDWRLKPGTVIDFELEQSHREQIGVNGYSLLGTTLPSPVDPRVNFTRQPWTIPGVFDAQTGSIRVRQTLENDWLWVTQIGSQHLKTDDRLTYGFGYNCYGADKICDRFTSSGDYEIDDYRSENEKRIVEVIQTQISGHAKVWNLDHHLSVEASRQRQLDRLTPLQTWNTAGYGNVLSGTSTSTESPAPSSVNTNRSEYSTELSIKDRIELSGTTSLWTGLRHVAFNKASSQNSPTYDTNPSVLQGHINLPWVGVSKNWHEAIIFASHGHGLEQNVTPNNSALYTNAGEVLGVSRSRQTELGVRSNAPSSSNWSATYFEISRPLVHDILDTTPQYPISTRYLDGTQTHKGVELSGSTSVERLRLSSSARWMHTSISSVEIQPETVGATPLNVPNFVIRSEAEYRYASVPGMRTGLRLSHEGERNVKEDGNTKLPAWTTWGASMHYDTKVNNIASTWSLVVDNLADKQYWREAPKQFGHYYLYPGAPRTIRATVQFRL
jgi:iron complex outermembrane receptor protein